MKKEDAGLASFFRETMTQAKKMINKMKPGASNTVSLRLNVVSKPATPLSDALRT